MNKNSARLALAISLITMGLSGCASVEQRESVRNEMPAAFKAVGTEATDVIADKEWWKSLDDRDLNDLVAQSLRSNSDIQIAAAQLLEAEAIMKGSESSFFPTLDLALRDSKGRQATGATEETSITKTKSANVALAYEIDIWGRITDIRDSKRAAMEATALDKKSVELSVLSNAVNGYLMIRQLDEEIQALSEISVNNEKMLAVVAFSVKEGYAKTDELEKVRESSAQSKSALERKREDRAKAENALSVLAGDPLYKLPVDTTYRMKGLKTPAAGLPSSLLENRPDLVSAEKRLESAKANISVAKKAFFPQISLTGSAGSQSSQMGNLMRSGSDIWSFGFGVDLPIFDGGLRLSNLMQSEAAEQLAVAQYQKSIRVAFTEVNDSLASLNANERVHKQSKIALSSSAKTLALVTDRYQQGYSSYTETLSEANNMLSNKVTEIGNRYETSRDIAMFYKALGI